MAAPDDEPNDPPTSEDWAKLVGSQRHDQYTPMGQIAMYGDFAMGVRRLRGWRRWVSLALIWLLLALLVAGVIGTLGAVLFRRT
ncbi:MAG: hypothetical protein LH645_05650 [Actinomycetia bacterium]|nr:hypothetical protein [Actinomycetes bacterium]